MLIDFIESPQNVTAFLNKNVEMRCRPNGTILFIWVLNDTPLQPQQFADFGIAADIGLNVLTINATTALNGSVFTCEARRGDELLISDPGILSIQGK